MQPLLLLLKKKKCIRASKVTGTENGESFLRFGEDFAVEGHRCSPCSFGASMGSEMQVSLSAPVWKCRRLLDCSDNEQQDPESPITCLAQQEPNLMELLSCPCDKSCASSQLWNPGHAVWKWSGRHNMPKKEKKVLFFSWISSAGSDLSGSHASACVGTVEEAAQRGEGRNCQRAKDHRKCTSAHVPMPCHCSLSYKKHFPIHSHLHTLLSRRQVRCSFLRLQSTLSYSAEGLMPQQGPADTAAKIRSQTTI